MSTTTLPGDPAGIDAHWYAAEGTAAAVAHAMLVQPARVDLASAIEHRDWQRALASAIECLRWITVCHQMLDGRGTARTGLEVDLLIAGSTRADPIDAIQEIVVRDATDEAAQRAEQTVAAAEAELLAELPLRLPVRRTPTGYRPSAEVVSHLERLRHRLGLPPFDWEGWIG